MTARALAAAAALAGGALGGCSLITDSFVTNDFSGDPYPIGAETSSGAVVVGARQAGHGDRVAVLDVLSPVTLVDPGAGAPQSVGSGNLLVLGARPGTGALDLPRAHLTGVRLISLHPCAAATCEVGVDATTRPFDAIIGADALAGDAIRLRLADDQVFVLADVGGPSAERTRACDAVFPAPYRGGGTMIVAATEIGFGGRRIAMPSCLGPDPDPARPQGQRGTDALLVVSTGVGPTILGESAYERYRTGHPGAPALDALPAATVYLPSGPVTGRRAVIDRIALVATSTTAPRAPCRQVYAHHFLIDSNCNADDDCPCSGGNVFCAVPASLELAPPAGLDVVVLGDADPTLQALRTELRPDQPEVDGILGADALRATELDIDYPHNRVLARCPAATCTARPAISAGDERDNARACLGLP